MSDLTPITREERLLNGEFIEPKTREEMILAGKDLDPKTRREYFLKKYRGADVEVDSLTATENKTYTAPTGKAYSPVTVNVPVPTLSSLSVSENGTYTAPSGTAYNEVDVDVPLPSNAYLLKEIEDVAIATFDDGSGLPMPKLEVGIEPVQEGSGEPSPTNVRPIHGWDECNVSDVEINLWDEEWELGYINSSGQLVNATDRIRTKNYIVVKPNMSLKFVSPTVLNVFYIIVYFYDANKNYVGTISNGVYSPSSIASPNYNNPFTVPQNAVYMKFWVTNSYGATYNNDISINYPSTDTSYHAYNGHNYTIDLDGTRFGGNVDLVSGVLTLKNGYKDLGTLTWGYNETYAFFYAGISDIKENTNNIICSAYKPIPSAQGLSEGGIRITSTSCYVKDSNYTDATAFKTAMNGVQLVYELATPITIQLTPTMIKSLRGKNNVFADTGNILDLSYLAKEE